MRGGMARVIGMVGEIHESPPPTNCPYRCARAADRASVCTGLPRPPRSRARDGNGVTRARSGCSEPLRATAHANIPGVQAGASSSTAISESFMVRGRLMSVSEAGKVEVSFMPGGSADGDDSVVAIAWGVPTFLLMPDEHGRVLASFVSEVMPVPGNIVRRPCSATGERRSHAIP
uniref:Uncharacterized protein n=1 Tax=Candidatus Kentrum sp. FW TaxID=2126338 RepID=A0A450TX10_9GAMM|nr:MAG: hypothetical protein BECKFW1821C_GA0114237_105410 [Candidatus Kentron sp. FW]